MDLRLDALVVDCHDPERLAAFWCELLGVEIRGRWEQYVGLHPMTAGHPRLVLQRTDDPRPPKNTLHLDLHTSSTRSLDAEVERAVRLGATLVESHQEEAAAWRTLADPEGNLFCIVAD